MKTDKKIIKYEDLRCLRTKADEEGLTIVFTSGCYDVLHFGHVFHFNFCKSKGDILVVSIGNDKTTRMLKGNTRPINNEKLRAKLVAALEITDYVVISEEIGKMDHNNLIELLRPDVFVLNANDSAVKEKQSLADKFGSQLLFRKEELTNGSETISTTGILKKLTKE